MAKRTREDSTTHCICHKFLENPKISLSIYLYFFFSREINETNKIMVNCRKKEETKKRAYYAEIQRP